MSTRLRIKIDLKALIAHLSREEGRAMPAEEVYKWLHDAGFDRDGPYWTVSESDLGQIEPSEVLEIRTLDDR